MSIVPTVDFHFRRNSNEPAIAWDLEAEDGAKADLSGYEVELIIVWRELRIVKNSGDNNGLVIDRDTSRVTWTPTLEESRKIPAARSSVYELYGTSSSTRIPLVTGYLIGSGGIT
jgi:hypothetical protein